MKNIKNIFLGAVLILLAVGFFPVFAQSAIQNYEKLLKDADTSLLNNKYEDALAALQKAKELNPDNPDIDAGLAFAYYYLNRSKDAIFSLKAAFNNNKIKNINDELMVCLALLYDNAGFREDAKIELDKYLQKCKERNDVMGMFMGRVLLKKITGR